MADVRALLRQQRQARRIEHPHAAYSDAGKLICVLCREPIRTEGLWDEHLRSTAHRKKQAATPLGTNSPSGGSESSAGTTSQKRKLDDNDDDDDDEGVGEKGAGDNDGGDADGRKRTKASSTSTLSRGSSTPSQGVEMQIPSRLTPSAAALREEERSASASSTSASASVTPRAGVSITLPVQPAPAPAPASAPTQVDETEWAAFEADIAAATAPPYDEDAVVISRPAMTAEESAAAAKKEKEGQDADILTRRAKADADIEDEREEATRALEEEFDEMQELEARVRRLKEKREALLRKRADSTAGGGMSGVVVGGLEGRREDKENLGTMEGGGVLAKDGDVDEEEEEEEEEEDDDDWDGFRFGMRRT